MVGVGGMCLTVHAWTRMTNLSCLMNFCLVSLYHALAIPFCPTLEYQISKRSCVGRTRSTAPISAQGSCFAMVVVKVLSHRYSWAQLGKYFLL
jgi:hypothetical protein